MYGRGPGPHLARRRFDARHHAGHLRGARQAGRQVLSLIEKDIRPHDILTREAFENAIVVHSAIGGSTNATIHLPSIARELGIHLEPELFDEINHKVPHLGNINPSGQHLTESFWFAGGVPLVQLYLKDMLHLDVMTVTGKTLGENLEDLQRDNFFQRNLGYLHNYGLERDQVIFPVDKAQEKGSVAILRGNLAPEGAVIKYSACSQEMREMEGPARVFDREEDAYQAVVDGAVEPGDILVIRYEGPRGSGMPEMLMTTEAIVCDEKLNGTVSLGDRRPVLRRHPWGGHRPRVPRGCQRRPPGLCGDRGHHRLQRGAPHLGRGGHPGAEAAPQEIAKVLAQRAEKGVVPRPPRKGLYKRYTSHALSAMEGAGYDD